jgi:uncharacterized protein YndB with AHSA1/START domain
MPSPSFAVSTEIRAAPRAVFAYVSDLSKHGEWGANELQIQAVDDAPLGVGKTYRSYAQARGREFHADLVITEYDPPNVFAFSGTDETGKFSHRFTFEKIENRTRVTRNVKFDLSLGQYVFYLIALNSVRLPAARGALERLKERLEASA